MIFAFSSFSSKSLSVFCIYIVTGIDIDIIWVRWLNRPPAYTDTTHTAVSDKRHPQSDNISKAANHASHFTNFSSEIRI